MPFIAVPNTAQITVLQELHGEEVVNVFHTAREGGYDLASLNDVADLVSSVWVAEMLPVLSNDLSFLGVRARNLAVQDGLQVELPPAEPTAGDRAFPGLPGNVAFCVTHRTALIGRSRRGRNYMAGLCDDQVVANLVNSGVAADLVAGWNTLRSTLNGAGHFFCVVSRFSNGDARPFGITTVITASVARDLRVDSQRGRLSS